MSDLTTAAEQNAIEKLAAYFDTPVELMPELIKMAQRISTDISFEVLAEEAYRGIEDFCKQANLSINDKVALYTGMLVAAGDIPDELVTELSAFDKQAAEAKADPTAPTAPAAPAAPAAPDPVATIPDGQVVHQYTRPADTEKTDRRIGGATAGAYNIVDNRNRVPYWMLAGGLGGGLYHMLRGEDERKRSGSLLGRVLGGAALGGLGYAGYHGYHGYDHFNRLVDSDRDLLRRLGFKEQDAAAHSARANREGIQQSSDKYYPQGSGYNYDIVPPVVNEPAPQA